MKKMATNNMIKLFKRGRFDETKKSFYENIILQARDDPCNQFQLTHTGQNHMIHLLYRTLFPYSTDKKFKVFTQK